MTKAAELAKMGEVLTNSQIGGRRNIIINGSQIVSQRTTSSSSVSSTARHFVTDRFATNINSLGTWTLSQDSNAPDGFSSSLKVDCTTADASPSAGDFILIDHRIEAQDLQQLKYGTSSAETITLSFYVKSNKTGNATVSVLQPDNSFKQASPSYTINSANTWERKIITIAGDTSGVINNDNDRGLEIQWWLNSGSTYTGGTNRTTYTTLSNDDRNASNLGIGGSTDDYFQITGVQLELGSQATPFEHRSFGEELALCQRYFQDPKLTSGNYLWLHAIATPGSTHWRRASYKLPTTMRADPAATLVGQTNGAFLSGSPTTEGTDHRHYIGFIGDVDANSSYAHINDLQLDAEL